MSESEKKKYAFKFIRDSGYQDRDEVLRCLGCQTEFTLRGNSPEGPKCPTCGAVGDVRLDPP